LGDGSENLNLLQYRLYNTNCREGHMGKTVLVLDDDKINIKIMQKQLEEAGFEVSIALNGEVGLDKAKRSPPDLILLDVEMPIMNGYSFKTEINKFPNLADIPVIVLSAHEKMQPIFKMKGVKDYVVKPVDYPKLFEKINKYLPQEE